MHQPPHEFAERRAQQQTRLERIAMGPIENEHRMHFARADAVGEAGRDEGAGTHADIDIALGQNNAL